MGGLAPPSFSFTIMGLFKSIGNALTKGISGGVTSLVSGAIGSLVGGNAQRKAQERAAQLQFENWSKTYNRQRMDALADYERNLKDQRQLMLDQASIQKQGLINAGINPANQAGNMTLSVPSVNNIDQADGSYNPVNQTAGPLASFGEYTQRMMDPLYRAQLDLVNAQVDKVKTDADKGKTEGEILKKQLEYASKTLNDRVNLVTQTLNEKFADVLNKGYEGTLKQGEIPIQAKKLEELNSQLTLLAEQITSAKAVAKYADQYNKKKVDELTATINNLDADTKVKKVDEELKKIEKAYKEIGININSELGQIGALILNSNSQPIAKMVLDGVKSMMTELIKGIPDAIGSITSEAVQGVPKLAVKTLKGMWDGAKGSFSDFIKAMEKRGYIQRYE